MKESVLALLFTPLAKLIAVELGRFCG